MNDLLKEYSPQVVMMSPWGSLLVDYKSLMKRQKVLEESLPIVEESFERYCRKVTPNNKLKMSGKPMKRRGV